MSQNRKVSIIILLAVAFSFTSLGISYGALNTINSEDGVATVQEKYTDVKLEGLKNIEVNDKAKFNLEPEIDATKLTFGISLSDKNAYGSCSFNVVNKGNIAAMVKEINIKGLEEYSDYITYNIDGIKVGDIIEAKTDPIMVNVSVNYNVPKLTVINGFYNEIGIYEEETVTDTIDLENVELEIIFE